VRRSGPIILAALVNETIVTFEPKTPALSEIDVDRNQATL
jgi:hypothetical protein